MSELLAIALLKWRRWMRRPAYWLLLAGTSFGLAFLFLRLVENYQEVRAAKLAGLGTTTPTQAIVAPFFEQAGFLLLVLIPLLTMRAIAGERESGTWILLRGAALSPMRIVLGKLLAISLLLLPPLLIAAAMPAILLGISGTLDWGHFCGALLGLWLLLEAIAAAGIYCSAKATDPVGAAMLGYGLILLLALFHATSTMPGAMAPTLYWLSPFAHFSSFLDGRFDSSDFLWFLFFILLFGGLAAQRLAVEDGSPKNPALRYTQPLAGVAVAIAGAWLAGQAHFSVDLSQQKINSPTPAAKKLLEKIAQPLTIEAIVADAPTLHRRIEKALRPYLDASPAISLKFSTPEAAAARDGGALQQQGRLEFHYGNRTEIVHTLGKAELLRTLQRLIEGREQWIVFLEGHGEKSPFDSGSDGYSTLNRLLVQQGFQTQAIDLLKLPAIPDNTTVLVVSTPTSAWLPGEANVLRHYLQRGGHLLLLRDPASDNPLDALLRELVLRPLPGIVIDADDRLRKLLAIRHPAVVPVTDFGSHTITGGISGRLLLPLATALEPTGKGSWRHHPLLFSGGDSWTETSDLKGHVRFDADQGEQAGPLTLGYASSRNDGGKKQRAVVIGDGDFINNQYIGFGDNGRFALRLFDWLATPDDGTTHAPPAGDAISMDDDALLLLAALLLLGLPLFFSLIAVLQWRRQRNAHA